eukprot:TRINITY_DN12782_c0_g1_i2.p1 TRINITY_DN12782_c0_g1~~TRINITY_DN12782_c0_g1_i2.p1  ORF type:complete len:572 (+),score=47.09 TRINITY_DN12782_c0_g1_i2:39-1754(+)
MRKYVGYLGCFVVGCSVGSLLCFSDYFRNGVSEISITPAPVDTKKSTPADTKKSIRVAEQLTVDRVAHAAPRKDACSKFAGKQPHQDMYYGITQIYIAHADPPNVLQKYFDDLPVTTAEVYATVVGSLSGINGLLYVSAPHIAFYDVNPFCLLYAQLFVELVSLADSRQHFLDSMYGRPVQRYLERTPSQNPYNGGVGPLADPADESLRATVREALSESARCVYDHVQKTYFMQGGIVSALGPKRSHRNCELISIHHNPEKNPRLSPDATKWAKYGVPNICSFYYGYGWLKDETTFALVREKLRKASVSYHVSDIAGLLEKLPAVTASQDSGNKVVVWISNIWRWFKKKRQETLNAAKKTLKTRWNSVTFVHANGPSVTVDTHWTPADCGAAGSGDLSTAGCLCERKEQGNPHRHALNALDHVLDGLSTRGSVAKDFPFVEVTRKVPWGFYEYKSRRENVQVDQFLKLPFNHTFSQSVLILHILVGEGESRPKFESALMKACGSMDYVVVLEHNANGKDWHSNTQASHFFSYGDLVKEMSKCRRKRITFSCLIAGSSSRDRNMIFLLEPLD